MFPGVRLAAVGVYGLGFIIAIPSAMIVSHRPIFRTIGVAAALVLAVFMYVPAWPTSPADAPLHVAGVQVESAGVEKVAEALGKLAEAHPEAQVLVLSEYTFIDVVPQSIRDVDAGHYHRYLIAGGIQWLDAKSSRHGLCHRT